ncbi:unnamed protein product [Orchesella dallaii]|uniref:Methyl farnesoate epoxidase n=1 Tax=Orchesella dallaii TaxID=48710 RepID=A0ABP1QLX8_9HEXA
MKVTDVQVDLVSITVFLISAVISLIGFLFRRYSKNGKQKPPGPFRFPIIGNLPNIYFQKNYPDVPNVFSSMAKQWGDIMSLKIGKNDTVVISSHEPAIAILNHDAAINRAVTFVMKDRLKQKNIGINFSNGSDWHTMRSFTMTSLKTNGIGKFSTQILDEVQRLIGHWNSNIFKGDRENNVILFENMFGGPVFNSVWRLLSNGQRFDYDDPKLTNLLNSLDRFNESTNLGVDFFVSFPALRKFLPEKLTKRNVQQKSLDEIRNLCYVTLKGCKENLSISQQPKSFFESFAAKIMEFSGNHHQHQCFNDDQFVITTMDLFQNAVDTVGSTLTFLILYTIMNPNAKKKVQEEVDTFISNCDNTSANASQSSLPYTFAFILETLRFSCSLPVIAPRVAVDDINLNGFHIEVGSSLLVNLRALNSSQEAWGDPQDFRPERFIDARTGQLSLEKTRLMLSFGSGRRVCPAQKFAEQMILIFFVELMKTYDFLHESDKPMPSISQAFGLNYSPKPFYAQIRKR